MFLLVCSALMSFLFGFVCPPLWVVTFLSIRSIVRHGREQHYAAHLRAEDARMKAYASWATR